MATSSCFREGDIFKSGLQIFTQDTHSDLALLAVASCLLSYTTIMWFELHATLAVAMLCMIYRTGCATHGTRRCMRQMHGDCIRPLPCHHATIDRALTRMTDLQTRFQLLGRRRWSVLRCVALFCALVPCKLPFGPLRPTSTFPHSFDGSWYLFRVQRRAHNRSSICLTTCQAPPRNPSNRSPYNGHVDDPHAHIR